MLLRIDPASVQSAKRFIARTSAALILLLVAGLSAFGALRLSIHGREVTVPDLQGKSDAEAATIANKLGLHLSVENRFYSGAIATNHVLSQLPAAGAIVRRGLQVRVTESLGTQQIPVPDITGQAPHSAEMMLKRSQLELGETVHLPAPGPSGTILAQTPPPNSTGLNGPRISVVVANDLTAAEIPAYVMPSLIGLSLYAANSRLASVGLRVSNSSEPDLIPPPDPDATVVGDPNAKAVGDSDAGVVGDPAIPPTVAAPLPISPDANVVSQSPAPGRRVAKGEAIRLTLARPTAPPS